jgi:hypothetical protein
VIWGQAQAVAAAGSVRAAATFPDDYGAVVERRRNVWR